jgi:sugar/nucleoside kinase (ribokinase family)
MIIVLGDIIADISMRIGGMPVDATDIQRVSYLGVGPGGATNVAIAAARFGLKAGCLGEIGDDHFGEIICETLAAEGVDISGVVLTPGGSTPVAAVLVDARSEPAYLGYGGKLEVMALPDAWRERIAAAEALFADGWAEHAGVPGIILEAFRHARAAGVPVFFDPGPGNPALDNGWHGEAAALASVVLANEGEARRLTNTSDPVAAARALLASGPQLVVLKRGVAGCVLLSAQGLELSPGFAVEPIDATGAGDSVAGATIYGFLRGLSLPQLGTLANATGAAKVLKLGTGASMPTRAEVAAMLARFGKSADGLL